MLSPCSTMCCVTTASSRNTLYAVTEFLARTKSRLMAIALEDLLGVLDQPNVPGTVDEHPNWRRRMPLAVDEIVSAIDVARLRKATREGCMRRNSGGIFLR